MSLFRPLTVNEELSFRQWARDNWKPGDAVNPVWHPVVRDEIAVMRDEDSRRDYLVTLAVTVRAYDAQDAISRFTERVAEHDEFRVVVTQSDGPDVSGVWSL